MQRTRLAKIAQFSLLQRFVLLSALVMVVGGLILGWWIDRRIFEVVAADNVTMAGVFVDSTVAPHIAELPSLDAITPAQEAHLLQLLRNNVASGRYVAVNLWRLDGTLLYSTLDNPVSDPAAAADVARALQGQFVSRETGSIRAAPPGTEVAGDGTRYLETYYAVRHPASGEPLAVVSFYQDLDFLRASVLLVRLQTWLAIASATVAMYLLLFSIVRQGSDTIEQQRAALNRSRRTIQQAAVRAAALNEASMRRLGAELHDGPAQDLGIALMRMEPLRAAVDRHVAAMRARGDGRHPGGTPDLDLEAAAYDLALIHSALESSLREVRNMAGGLRLPELSALDVAASIEKAALDYTRKTGRAVEVSGPSRLEGSAALKSAAYRIVQEALNNGYQHGSPAHQRVRYARTGDRLLLEVADDGAGFDPAQLPRHPRRPLGLAGLQERAEILGGRLEVRSAPGQGTTVRAFLPLAGELEQAAGEMFAAAEAQLDEDPNERHSESA